MRNKFSKSMMVISIIIIPVLLFCASTKEKQVVSKDAQFNYCRGGRLLF